MKIKYILMLLLIAALLVACGGGDEPAAATEAPVATEEPTKPVEPTAEPEPTDEPEPTAEPEPTDEPEPTAEPEPTDEPEPTAEPEPTDEPEPAGIALPELVQIDEAGVSVNIPEGYSVQIFGESAEIAPPDATTPQDGAFLVSGSLYQEDETFETIRTDLSESLTDFNEVGEPQPFEGAAGDAFYVDFAHEEDGESLAGRVVVIDQENQAAILFGLGGDEAWEMLAETFDAVARTVEFFEPVVSVEESRLEDEATTDDTSADDDATDEGQTQSNEQPATAVVVGDGEPGMACFSARGDGLTCLLADGTWQQITEDNSQIGSDYVTAMTACNGAILMGHTSGLSRYDGSAWQEYNDGWGVSSPDDLACDANGGIWVAHFRGISYFDGSAWTTFSSDDVLGGETLVYAVEISADGTVWVLTSASIASYDGSTWTTYTEADGLGDRYFFADMTLDANGTVWAAHSNGLLYLEDGAWIEVESPGHITPENIIATADGGKWVGTFDDGILIFNGATTTRIDRANDNISSDAIESLASDDSGRLWVGTEYGLNIWNGSEWTIYDMDSSDLMNNSVDSIAIVGGGPALPSHVDKANGGLVGTVTENDAPVAESRVELCVEAIYSRFDGDTPCDGQPLSFQTVTDADGAFVFEDIPVGNYLIVVETSDSWAKMTTDFGFGSEFTPVAEGETTDVGELRIEVEE